MHRRHFLSTLVVTAGPLLGCSSSDSDPPPSPQEPEVPDDLETDPGSFPQSVASGDPRPNSIILWTRSPGEGDVQLQLQIARDEDLQERVSFDGEPELEVVARAEFDHCVRVRVDGLDSDTTYYYRFTKTQGDGRLSSRVGRTKTAPEPDSERNVRFAVMSCQDYGGRYYHVHRFAAEQDIDFVVHLGDYIYETAGDPSFQASDSDRAVTFEKPEEALQLTSTESAPGSDQSFEASFLAAYSLSNYRDLYRLARSDEYLQRLHERHPMICVWDDHEFSNDCYGETATYLSGLEDEHDPERRANADQAWFEYMPVDYPEADDFEFDKGRSFPDNLRIARDFHFGKHLHLVMTDLRRYRSDHIIPEDAPPGAVAVTQARLEELFGEVPDLAEPYVNIDELGDTKDRLVTAYDDGMDFGSDPARLAGNVNVPFLNALIEQYNLENDDQPLDLVNPEDAELKRGVAFVQVGKTSDHTSFGSRNFVEPDAFQIVAADRFDQSGGESEQVMGEDQEAWFIETMNSSQATWKVWGNSYTLATRSIDLSSLALPGNLGRRFLLSADDWDGMPNRRLQLVGALSDVENLVAVTGDSHSFFASGIGIDGADNILEFVCGAVSSSTYQSVLQTGGVGVPGIDLLAPLAGPLIAQANAHIAYQNVADNGFGIVEADADHLLVSFFEIGFAKLFDAELEGELENHFVERRFRVAAGEGTIEQELDGVFKRWDLESQRFV